MILLIFLLLMPIPAQAKLIFSNTYNDGTFGTTGPGGNIDECVHKPTLPNICVSPFFQSVPNPGAITVMSSPSPLREGIHSVRHIAKPGQLSGHWDPCYLIGGDYTGDSHCDRSESERSITYFADRDEWYGFSVYIDSITQYSDTNSPNFHDPNGQVIFQAHQLGGSCGSGFGPRLLIYFREIGGHYWAINDEQNGVAGCAAAPTGNCASVGAACRIAYDLGAWTFNTWNDFIIHAKWSTTTAGVLQIWRRTGTNGTLTQLVNVTGINSLNGFTNTDVKWGAYQSWWVNHAPPAGEQTVVYHDSIKVGDQNSVLADVDPGASAVVPNAPSSVSVLVH